MLKISLSPLDSEAAKTIAQRRGIPVDDLISILIQREAAIEIANWRSTSKPTDTSASSSSMAQPQQPQAVQP